ncbi:hypothetical protein BDQ12DRAFT_683228 [Crucibulum laeve]|uniref:Uncharacterized protein n=1 Tax=Crucibulum laeve TaxID=68775 RepID=A0A5C3LZU6_9AGAR|nr:hypothetical protein BDQ12DRAFT_683228 [Crucibulum laeve]
MRPFYALGLVLSVLVVGGIATDNCLGACLTTKPSMCGVFQLVPKQSGKCWDCCKK